MDSSRKNVAVLAVCQGLLLTNNSILITVNTLVGYALAANKAPASGALFTIQGWQAVNMWAVPILLLAGAGVLWLAWMRRHPTRTA